MSIKVFEPQTGMGSAETVGLILLNHVGSSVSQDTGRDAHDLADRFRMAVIAADRPGTAGFVRRDKLADDLSTGPGYAAEMTHLGIKLDKQVESLGLKHMIVMGRSAGGLGALALTLTETVSTQTAVFAADPVGCEAMTIKQGECRFKEYARRQSKIQEELKDIVLPINEKLPLLPALGRLASIPSLFLFDKFHNAGIWASDASLAFARHIAEQQPDIDTTIEFAEHSLVVTDAIYEEQVKPLETLRMTGQPFNVIRTKNTTHASYDNRSFMASRLRPVVERIVQGT